MNDITGSLNNIVPQLTNNATDTATDVASPLVDNFLNKIKGSSPNIKIFTTTPIISPDQINQETLKNINLKEITKLNSDIILNIIK